MLIDLNIFNNLCMLISCFMVPITIIFTFKLILLLVEKGSYLKHHDHTVLNNDVESVKNDKRDLIEHYQVGATLVLCYILLLGVIQVLFINNLS
jgi:hypothetical protein